MKCFLLVRKNSHHAENTTLFDPVTTFQGVFVVNSHYSTFTCKINNLFGQLEECFFFFLNPILRPIFISRASWHSSQLLHKQNKTDADHLLRWVYHLVFGCGKTQQCVGYWQNIKFIFDFPTPFCHCNYYFPNICFKIIKICTDNKVWFIKLYG